jgi:D-sedoheptulose 7-phosphate isomerase
MKELIKQHIFEHRSVVDSLVGLEESIEKIAGLLVECLKNEGTIFWCGNGGSASDSQHLAGELVGRFKDERKPLKSIALNTDSAVMTCIVNDYGYEYVFSRQVDALGVAGDILVGISTSGNSINVLNAFDVANQKDMITVGLLGKGGGKARSIAKQTAIVNSKSTARIQ